jgi:hypothetical protein
MALTRRGRSDNTGTQAGTGTSIPQQVLYRHVFHHVSLLKKKADDADAKGEDGNKYRGFYKHQAHLSDDQAKSLETIALDCDTQVTDQDNRAKTVIDSFRAQHATHVKGEPVPPAPDEIKAMQEARNAITLKARDQLHAALGDQDFKRFDDFVQHTMGPAIETLIPERRQPAGQRPPQLLPPGTRRGTS